MMTAFAFLLFTLLCLAMGGARSWSNETRAERNALVFHGRNHAYGAYRLRMGYDRRMAMALLAALCLLGLAAALPRLLGRMMPPASVPPAEQTALVVDLLLPPSAPAPRPERPAQATAPVQQKAKQPAEPQWVEAVDSLPAALPPRDTVPASVGPDEGAASAGDAGTGAGDDAGASPSGSSLGSSTVLERFEVQELPEFPGGEAAMQAWVGRNVRFPEEAQGRDMIYVQFVIGLDGTVEEVKAVKGEQPALKAAAEQAVRRMPRWRPARMNGHDVRCRLTLPIRFETR